MPTTMTDNSDGRDHSIDPVLIEEDGGLVEDDGDKVVILPATKT